MLTDGKNGRDCLMIITQWKNRSYGVVLFAGKRSTIVHCHNKMWGSEWSPIGHIQIFLRHTSSSFSDQGMAYVSNIDVSRYPFIGGNGGVLTILFCKPVRCR